MSNQLREKVRALTRRVEALEARLGDNPAVDMDPAPYDRNDPDGLAIVGIPGDARDVYSAEHEGFGRWVLMKNGERMDNLLGDHPDNPDGSPPRWFTKSEAAKMAVALSEDQAA